MKEFYNFIKKLGKVFGVFLIYLFLPSFLYLFFSEFIGTYNKLIISIIKILSSLITLLIILCIYREDLKKYLTDFKKNWKKNLFWIIIIFAAFTIGGYFVNTFIERIVGTLPSTEVANRNLVTSDLVYSFSTLCFINPFMEEIIFRYNVRKLINNKYLFIILSSLFFGLAHVISTSGIEYLYLLSYFILGLSFSIIYIKTDNIYGSIIAHILNNIIAIMLLFI